jgi:hypothetical protein
MLLFVAIETEIGIMWWHRRLACAGLIGGRDARRYELFMIYGWANGPCATVLKSSSGGTGFPACAARVASGDARPTNLFMF